MSKIVCIVLLGMLVPSYGFMNCLKAISDIDNTGYSANTPDLRNSLERMGQICSEEIFTDSNATN